MTETSPRRHRDKTETSPNTETSPKPDRDKTETSPRQDRDMTETSPRQDRDILGEFFSGAWAAPGRLIHVRPQAYRYWGRKKFLKVFYHKNSPPKKKIPRVFQNSKIQKKISISPNIFGILESEVFLIFMEWVKKKLVSLFPFTGNA